MSKAFRLFLVIIMVVMLSTIGMTASIGEMLSKDEVLVDGAVVFHDSALRQAIESAMNSILFDGSAKEYLEKVPGISLINLENPVRDISPLQLAKSLKEISIDCSSLNSLEPLVSCASLTKVSLSNIGSLSLEPLTRIKKLNTLYIQCQVSDLSSLAECKALKDFVGIELGAVSLAPLATAPKLQTVAFANIETIDFAQLADAKKISTVELADCGVVGLDEWLTNHAKTLSSLRLRNLTFTPGMNEAIGACRKLTELVLTQVQGIDLDAISGASSLQTLVIDTASDIGSFQMLNQLKKLQMLELYQIKGAAFDGIEALPRLTTLTLDRVEADDFTFICQAPKLSNLTIQACRPGNFAFLSELKCTKALSSLLLMGLSIDDMQFANELKKLRELILVDTNVADISALASLPVEGLILCGNPIVDYSPLKSMKKLKSLALRSTFDNSLLADFTLEMPNVSIEKIDYESMVDPLYSAAVFYGDKDAVKRADRPDVEAEASQKALQLARDQKNARLIEELTEPTEDELSGLYIYPASDIVHDGFTASEGALSFCQIENHPALKLPTEVNGLSLSMLHLFIMRGDVETLCIPATVRDIRGGIRPFNTNPTSYYLVDPANEWYTSVDGVIYTKDMKTLIACPQAYSTFEVPEGVTTIPVAAFFSGEQTVKIPASVTIIENHYTPGANEEMGFAIDDIYTRVSRFEVDDNNPAYSDVDGNLANKAGDTLLLACHSIVPDNHTMIIPEGIQTLADYSFRYDWTSLKSVKIPASLTKVSDDFLSACSFVDEFIIDPDNQAFSSDAGFLLSKDGKTLLHAANEERVIIPDGVEYINTRLGRDELTIPASVRQINFPLLGVKSIVVSPDNATFKMQDDCLLSKDGKTLYYICANALRQDGTIVLPDGIEVVEPDALRPYVLEYWEPTTVVIPESLQNVDETTFGYSITIKRLTD